MITAGRMGTGYDRRPRVVSGARVASAGLAAYAYVCTYTESDRPRAARLAGSIDRIAWQASKMTNDEHFDRTVPCHHARRAVTVGAYLHGGQF